MGEDASRRRIDRLACVVYCCCCCCGFSIHLPEGRRRRRHTARPSSRNKEFARPASCSDSHTLTHRSTYLLQSRQPIFLVLLLKTVVFTGSTGVVDVLVSFFSSSPKKLDYVHRAGVVTNGHARRLLLRKNLKCTRTRTRFSSPDIADPRGLQYGSYVRIPKQYMDTGALTYPG